MLGCCSTRRHCGDRHGMTMTGAMPQMTINLHSFELRRPSLSEHPARATGRLDGTLHPVRVI
jgi:hypothetical protein